MSAPERLPEAAGFDRGVACALKELLARSTLKLSMRNRRFLSFVVEETLAGRKDRIKAYSIGIDVFGRHADFDPGVDPIVRIEANRIRAALSAYYEGPGQSDAIHFMLPPGGYVPSFVGRSRGDDDPHATQVVLGRAVAAEPQRAAIVVEHQTASDCRQSQDCGEIIFETIVSLLCEQRIEVYLKPSETWERAATATNAPLSDASCFFELKLAVHDLDAGRRCCWRLIDLKSGKIVSSGFTDQSGNGPPHAGSINRFACSVTDAVIQCLVKDASSSGFSAPDFPTSCGSENSVQPRVDAK